MAAQPCFFQPGHPEYFVNRFFFGGQDEGTGIDDDDVCGTGFTGDIKAAFFQDGSHHFGVHLIFWTAQADNMDLPVFHLGTFLTSTFLGFTPSEGPTMPSASICSISLAARL